METIRTYFLFSLQLEGVSLPVVRCLATSQLDLAEVLVDILLDSVHQQKLSQMKSRDKPSIERVCHHHTAHITSLLILYSFVHKSSVQHCTH